MKFIIEKVSNMIFLSADCGTIFKSWDEYTFTEKKLSNAIKKIQSNIPDAEFTRKAW